MTGIALVTGGSRGIGAATALKLGALGYIVVLTYAQDRSAADLVVKAIEEAGGKALAYGLDIASEQQVVRLFEAVDAMPEPLTLLVNNAGVTEGFSKLEALTYEQLQRVFQVNVFGAFMCAREAVRRMGHSHGGKGGVIINVSSRAAQLGGSGEWIHYAATKGALDTLTVGLAKEVARDGIRVNGVAPGLIDTELHAANGKPERVADMAPGIPMARAGLPEEVADCVAWIASAGAGYVTGAIVPVSGGR